MADFVRLIWSELRRAVYFGIGFALVAVLALRMENAEALECTNWVYTQAAFSECADQNREWCDAENSQYSCESNTCTFTPSGGAAVHYPGTGRVLDQSTYVYCGFDGACPAEGAEGPNLENTSGAGQSMANQHCNGPCKVESTSCTSVGPLPDGTTNTVCATQYTGEQCSPSPANPEAEPNDPQDCDPAIQIGGKCIAIDDDDGDPDDGDMQPSVCIGATCNEVPPNPNHSADCETGADGAVCVGTPSGGTNSAPHPPSPPYPPNQAPAWSGGSGHNGTSTPVQVYGPPDDGDAGPPDEGGQCPTGTTLYQGVCMCPVGQSWGGAACYDSDDGDEDGCTEEDPDYPNCQGEGERTAEFGTCATGNAPACSGDQIDCSILKQTWATRCALLGSEAAPGIDLETDPLDEYGGPDAFFSTGEAVGPGSLDEGGFLGGGSCPTYPSINVFGTAITISPVWCELSFLGTMLVALAYLAAIRIVYGD